MSKMIVISLDAFGSQDLDYARNLPHFSEFFKQAALVEEVRTIYPSLTYMCHSSISTGFLPADHGVVNNTKKQDERESPDWYWFDKDLKKETFFELTKRAGYSTASFLWPVTGRNPWIDYNLVEIFPNRRFQSQAMVSLYAGSPRFTIELDRKFGHLRKGIQQPNLDDFLTASLVYTLDRYRPDFTAVHYVALDAARHEYGVSSGPAKAALRQMDRNLGKIIQQLKAQGEWETSYFALLGDHYQIDVNTAIKPQVLLKRWGWTDVQIKSADGACYVYCASQARDMSLFFDFLDPYVSNIYNQGQARSMGADPECSYILEAYSGFYFEDGSEGELVNSVADQDHFKRAVHGYHPDKPDYTTFFAVRGPGIRPKKLRQPASLVDLGPTLMDLLDLTYSEETKGRVLDIKS